MRAEAVDTAVAETEIQPATTIEASAETEITSLIDRIKDASAIDRSLYYGNNVFDSTAMAPLSPASAVRTVSDVVSHYLISIYVRDEGDPAFLS